MSRSRDRSIRRDLGSVDDRREHRTRSRSPGLSHHQKGSRNGEGHSRHRDYRTREERHERSHRKESEKSRHESERKHRHSEDPDSSKAHHKRRRRRSQSSAGSHARQPSAAATLPFDARTLSRWDYAAFEPLFAHYLGIQKQIYLGDLDDHEVKGRWKSFVGKWNRGELAEGWYDPEMFARAKELASENGVGAPRNIAGRNGDAEQVPTPPLSGKHTGQRDTRDEGDEDRSEEDDNDDEWGPTLPGAQPASHSSRHGPAIPSMQDLQVRREQDEEDRLAQVDALRLARKADRAEQKERLDDLVPRADAGTRERRLEKRAAVNDKMRAFREGSPTGGAAVDDAELMGDGGGIEEHKRAVAAAARRRTEREVRREEAERARAEEREERMREYREREEATVDKLRELARARFG